MRLYHFSEEPDIERFEPRAPLERPHIEPLVWAIDEWHAPMYYLPRDCPRACFWAGPDTTAEDRARWAPHAGEAIVICIESHWLQRVRETQLYRYLMPAETFVLNDATAGHYVSRAAVAPLSVEPVGDLLEAIAGAGVELRIMPSLVELWRDVIASTLEFSGTRLRNARGYEAIAP
jgi:hypothetical protein